MLELPGGAIVDLSADRAKFHALRQPGVSLSSEHRELYVLVDVVIRRRDEEGTPCRGWTEFDYDFSGYTLGSIRFATDWSDDDRSALFRWAELDQQRRIIESSRRRLIEDQPRLSAKTYSAAKQFYSLLKNRLHDLPLKQASVAQWRATIANMTKTGLRQEEIQWSGLSEFLRNLDAEMVLSRTDIIKQLSFKNICLELSTEQIWGRNGGLAFREVGRRMPHQAVYRAALKLDSSCHCILRYVDSRFNYRVGVVKNLDREHAMALNKFWFALDPYGRAIPNPEKEGQLFFDCGTAAKAAADNHARKFLGMRSGESAHTRFDHLTLFGGNDYREWIVSMPDFQRIFFGAHFYDHNVLVHIRTTTRTDLQGRLILFIEEVQSDWHQSGKRNGYDNSHWGSVANAPFKKEWPALAAKLMLIQASQNGFAGIAWPRGDIQETRYHRDLAAIKNHYDKEIPAALNRLGKAFHTSVEITQIETRDPWLNLEKSRDKWRVADGSGKFQTRLKYSTRDEAMGVIARHCKSIELDVQAFMIGDELRGYIADKGLPLFGETLL